MSNPQPTCVDTALPLRGGRSPRDFASDAEAAGYDALWSSEIAHDPFLQMAAAATATERIELGTGIAVAFSRNPMNVAQLSHDLQGLSNGRFLLGLGTQVKAHVTRRFSMPWSRPAARMREFVLALHAIWDCWESAEKLAFEGEFYTHTLMTPMFIPESHGHPRPPVIVAAVGDRMVEVAGEVGDGMLCHSFMTERFLREQTLASLERGRKSSRRDAFQLVGGPFVATGSTPEEIQEASDAVRSQIAFYGSTPSYWPVLEAHGWGELGQSLHVLSRAGEWRAMSDAVSDEVLHAFAAVGTPEEVAGTLLARYGDIFDRFAIVTPYELSDAARIRVAQRLRGRQ